MAEDGENGGKKAAKAAGQAAKLAGKTIFKAIWAKLTALFSTVAIVTLVVILIIFLMIGAILGNDEAQAADVGGECTAGNAYAAQKGYGPNPTIINIIYQVLQQMHADATVQLAAYDTAIQESGIRNLANVKIPDSYAVGQDGKPMFPYDPYQPGNPYASDGMSVGVFQQQVGLGWATGTTDQQLKKLMDPAYATQQFVERAMHVEKTAGTNVGAIIIDVQAPANSDPSAYLAHGAQAAGYLTQAKNGTAGAGTGTSASGVVCSSVGTLVPTCTTTGTTSKCTVAVTEQGVKCGKGPTAGAGTKYIISLPVNPDGKPSEAGNAISDAVAWVDKGECYSYGGGGRNLDGPSPGQCGGGGLGNNDCNVSGFDCSALVRYAIAKGTHNRIVLPRTSEDQYNSALLTTVGSPSPGDLVFSEEGEDRLGEPGHVTMYIGKMRQQGNTWVSDPKGIDMVVAASESTYRLKIQPMSQTEKAMPHPYGHPNYK